VASRSAKLILGVILLLAGPLGGLGGRVQAGFALEQRLSGPDRSPSPFGLALVLIMNGEDEAKSAVCASPAQTKDEGAIVSERQAPQRRRMPCALPPAPGDCQTKGASSGAGRSTGPGGRIPLSPSPPQHAPTSMGEESGLCLADERCGPALFPARLFRPPR
jgi:hypothetical protein